MILSPFSALECLLHISWLSFTASLSHIKNSKTTIYRVDASCWHCVHMLCVHCFMSPHSSFRPSHFRHPFQAENFKQSSCLISCVHIFPKWEKYTIKEHAQGCSASSAKREEREREKGKGKRSRERERGRTRTPGQSLRLPEDSQGSLDGVTQAGPAKITHRAGGC